jgi:hypothetical protein
MWTKIKGIEDINKIKLNSRVLKFTGSGIPLDPPTSDPAYTLYSLIKNTGGNLDLKSTNPLFSSSLSKVNTNLLQTTASQMIEEGVWWF